MFDQQCRYTPYQSNENIMNTHNGSKKKVPTLYYECESLLTQFDVPINKSLMNIIYEL